MINAYVVEDHNDALEHIYKEIGSKRLRISNLTMIHFDSHPDLGIPTYLKADDVFNKTKLFESLSIENWILPAVYAQHINKLVWIKPNWSQQIQTGAYKLVIGKHTQTGLIKTDSTLSYFISDDLYSNQANLTNKRELDLLVCDFETILSDQTLLNEFMTNEQIILDVDLDFFSTRDPFKLMFSSSQEYDLFKQVYQHPIPLVDENFDLIYENYKQEKQTKNDQILTFLKSNSVSTSDSKLSQLKEIILKNEIDLEILHNYGSGIDECALPDHLSSDAEITSMMSLFKEFLTIYFSQHLKPKCITVARSSLDDYCPPHQVESIQTHFINLINSHFTKLTIKNCYE